MNDFDLSDLLEEQPAPENGARSARQIATRRRRRRQVVAGSLGAILLMGAATTALVQTKSSPDQAVVIRDAGSSNETTTTTTVPETTTTTVTPDPRQRYVGLEHDESGAGLPLGTSLKLSGMPEPTPSGTDDGSAEGRTTKVGDTLLFWTRDAKGDMLWIDTVTRAPKNYDQPLFAKVQAVFDIPKVGDDQYLCIGWCGKSDGSQVPGVVGIYKSDPNGKETFSYAARIDVAKRTLVEVSTKGLTSWPTQHQEVTYPSRPELYSALSEMNQMDRERVQALEGVVVNGGGGWSDTDYQIVEDYFEKKEVFVAQKRSEPGKRTQVIVDSVPNGDFNFGGEGAVKYKGTLTNMALLYVEQDPQVNDQPIIRAAYLLDETTFTFKQVATTDVEMITPTIP